MPGGIAPTVIAVRRREIDEPDAVEIALDQPPPSGEITRFSFDDGEVVNIVEFADFQIGQAACCLIDGSCQNLTEEACNSLTGAVFRGGGTSCLGDNDSSGEDDACDDLFLIPTVSDWGVVFLTTALFTAGTILIRRPRTVFAGTQSRTSPDRLSGSRWLGGRSYPGAASASGGLAPGSCLAGLQPATPSGGPVPGYCLSAL